MSNGSRISVFKTPAGPGDRVADFSKSVAGSSLPNNFGTKPVMEGRPGTLIFPLSSLLFLGERKHRHI